MTKKTVLNQQKFWEILEYLIQLDKTENFDKICTDLNISKGQLNSFIHFLKEVNCELKLIDGEGSKEIGPAEEIPQFQINFNLIEWLKFQAHFPLLNQYEDKPFHQAIKNKLRKVETFYKGSDLFEPLETFENIYGRKNLALIKEDGINHNETVALIEEAILNKKVLSLVIDEKSISLYPRKIVFFDGDFNLIAENVTDNGLLNLKITHIQQIDYDDKEWREVFSKFEIDEFVSSLRSMCDVGTRLVLKIYNQENFNMNLDYQFFENPCAFANSSGESIWAATIEPNAKIFHWLYKLGSDVEILDPKEFKLEFLKYCENKLKKIA